MLSLTHGEIPIALAAYQDSIWPAQPLAYALAVLALVALINRKEIFRRLTLGILALLWAWAAVAYHLLFFIELEPAATIFGLLFGAQAGLLSFWAFRRRPPPDFRFRANAEGVVGITLIIYALAIYPLLDFLMLAWPRIPWLGISPCPVTLFTFGFFLLVSPRLPVAFWIVPIGWALLAGVSALLIGVTQDWVLLLSGLATLLLVLSRDRKREKPDLNAGSAHHAPR